ncbi:MAG: 2-hydroxychromene-2-carboxylate isomerase [Chromatiales bacterium]|nr:2-hydroxychromene-2-carboxylate isomerase [Chromatiales bacterium]
MPKPIEFWFDFSSPYGYLASHRIGDIAARFGREVLWRPFLIGAVMQRTGSRPLVERNLIGAYAAHDFERFARLLGVPFRLPDPFPVSSVAASRAFYWQEARDPAAAPALARALYAAYFVDGRDISQTSVVVDVAAGGTTTRAEVEAGIQDQAIKDRLRKVTDGAAERGIFGSPFVIVDGEAFWGCDRLPQVERWLETGGW